MCEINPRHSAFFRLEAFTSHDMTEKDFADAVIGKLLLTESGLNMDGRFRFHIHGEDTMTGETSFPEANEAIKKIAEEATAIRATLNRIAEALEAANHLAANHPSRI